MPRWPGPMSASGSRTSTSSRRAVPRRNCATTWPAKSSAGPASSPAPTSPSSKESRMQLQRIGLVGYGEVGKTFSRGLLGKPGILQSSAWDLKFEQAAVREQERTHAEDAGVIAQPSMQALCESSDLVISAVTASDTLDVARE